MDRQDDILDSEKQHLLPPRFEVRNIWSRCMRSLQWIVRA